MTQDSGQDKQQTTIRQPMVYRDFHLRLANYQEANGSGTFKVWVEGEAPSGGTMRPDDAAMNTYNPKDFWAEPTTGWGGLVGGIDDQSLARDDLFKLGAMLADLALPAGNVRNLFQESLNTVRRSGEGLRLRLHIDAVALTQLPWEYMQLPTTEGQQDTDFFALRREISIVRSSTVEAVPFALPTRPTARIVGVLSSPSDLTKLKVNNDRKAIQAAIDALNEQAHQKMIEMVWASRPATYQAVESALADGADIFHYAGHAMFQGGDIGGGILLEREDYKADFYSSAKLAQLLRDAFIRLVMLGACETGHSDGQNEWSSVASALTREKIPVVIANQFAIEDSDASLIASRMYPLILGGYSIDEALYEARRALYQKHANLEEPAWGIPVLYMQVASGVLFPSSQVTAADQGAGSPFLRVANTFKRISGNVIEIKMSSVNEGTIELNSDIGEVEPGGSYTGIQINTFGR